LCGFQVCIWSDPRLVQVRPVTWLLL
jgi:hypothetical protein